AAQPLPPALRGPGLALALLATLACGGGARPTSAPPPNPPAAPAAAAPTAAAPAPPSAATGASAAPGPAARTLGALSQPVDVKIGVQSSISDAGVYIAIARGYFRELGLNATAETFAGGAADYVQFIATDQLQAGGPSSVPALYNAADRGVALHVVADKGKLRAGFGYLRLSVRKELADSGAVSGLADLRGRTIAVASPYGAAH